MIKKLLMLISLLLVIAVGLAWAGYRMQQERMDRALPVEQVTPLHVENGTWFRQFANQLVANGLLDDAVWLRAEAYLNPGVTRIKAGEYEIEPGMTLRQLLDKVVAGETVSHSFTLVEGMTFRQLRERLLADDRLEHRLKEMDEQALLQALGSEYTAIEGLFLAETYQFQRGTTDLQLLQRAHEDLEQVLEQAWAQRKEELPYKTPYEVLIMASIIEKETAVPAERNQISGVFVRRLQRGMRLQTDPTVIYGMGERYRGNITRADLRRPTPWNTYTIDGLPPTPIALVGREAIAAAVTPEPGKALYFVAKGDGSHQFSNSLREHNNAVRRYQLQRRQDYRSTPQE